MATDSAVVVCKIVIVGAVLALLVRVLGDAHWNALVEVRAVLQGDPFGVFLLATGTFFFLVSSCAFLWRLYLVLRYRPVPACGDEELLSCTVVVPAYNEGRQVADTLYSLLASDYPADKLQIIAVDDGSRDDTWRWIHLVASEHPTRVQGVRQSVNRGKRHALLEGFRRARGEVLVTVDSDSIVTPRTVRRLVSPICRNPLCGAVAGNVRVLNRRQGLLPRMLDVQYLYSFDFIRASQSMVNAVICTPGALSAYRRGPVENVLADWINQRFLGRPATIGDDRAMTNLILRQGYHVLFQRDALVYTQVPARYDGACRMFLRWARSNVRETYLMGRFIFADFRPTPKLGARVNFLLQVLALTFAQVYFLASLGCLLWRSDVFAITLLTGIAIRSMAPMALYVWRYRDSDALLALSYGVLWCFGMSWITPYALVTLRQTGWVTRQGARGLPGRRFRKPLRQSLPS